MPRGHHRFFVKQLKMKQKRDAAAKNSTNHTVWQPPAIDTHEAQDTVCFAVKMYMLLTTLGVAIMKAENCGNKQIFGFILISATAHALYLINKEQQMKKRLSPP